MLCANCGNGGDVLMVVVNIHFKFVEMDRFPPRSQLFDFVSVSPFFRDVAHLEGRVEPNLAVH